MDNGERKSAIKNNGSDFDHQVRPNEGKFAYLRVWTFEIDHSSVIHPEWRALGSAWFNDHKDPERETWSTLEIARKDLLMGPTWWYRGKGAVRIYQAPEPRNGHPVLISILLCFLGQVSWVRHSNKRKPKTFRFSIVILHWCFCNNK